MTNTLYNLDRNHPKTAWLKPFLLFLSLVKVRTKDNPEPRPLTLFDAQKVFLSELCDALEADCHFLCVLKARQLGISTILLLLDVFWLMMHPNLTGGFIADTDENVQNFRETLVDMLDSLPEGYKVPIDKHNRYYLRLKNGSMLQYMRGGGARNDKLGRSRALTLAHGTELCRWQDAKAVDSMIDSFATEHPHRLYVFESTALGAGLWQDMYDNAAEDGITRRACFIGWWAKNTYRYERDAPQFKRWWADDPNMSDYEHLVTELIKEQYGYEIEPEQWAWYRERAAGRSTQSMREEMPSFAEEAFQYSGHSFFNQRAIATDQALIRSNAVTFDGFAYSFGRTMLEMDVQAVKDPDAAQLKVWEYPVGRVGNAEGAKYVMGIDPSYCSNPDSDNAVIEVFRCYGDKLVQVAEFVANNVQPNHLAWVICHLAGEYTGATGADMMFNLEINGPGNEVARQLKDLKFQILNDAPSMREPGDTEGWLRKALEKTRWYIYRREDGIMGAGGSYHSKTTSSTKVVWLNCMRDLYSMEQLVIRSPLLLDEMRTIKQDGDDIRASGRNNDDRVMSAALAIDAYWQHVRRGMLAAGRTFLAEKARERQDGLHEPEQNIYTTMIPRYLDRRRTQMRAEQIEAMRQRIIGS